MRVCQSFYEPRKKPRRSRIRGSRLQQSPDRSRWLSWDRPEPNRGRLSPPLPRRQKGSFGTARPRLLRAIDLFYRRNKRFRNIRIPGSFPKKFPSFYPRSTFFKQRPFFRGSIRGGSQPLNAFREPRSKHFRVKAIRNAQNRKETFSFFS